MLLKFGGVNLQLLATVLFQVYPVLFNVGINEEQTLADRFGNTNLQDYLNVQSWKRTLKYYDLVSDSYTGWGKKTSHISLFEKIDKKTKFKIFIL